jgi:hypothetical protein
VNYVFCDSDNAFIFVVKNSYVESQIDGNKAKVIMVNLNFKHKESQLGTKSDIIKLAIWQRSTKQTEYNNNINL